MNLFSCAMLHMGKSTSYILTSKVIRLAVMGKYHSKLLMLFNLSFLMKCKYNKFEHWERINITFCNDQLLKHVNSNVLTVTLVKNPQTWISMLNDDSFSILSFYSHGSQILHYEPDLVVIMHLWRTQRKMSTQQCV